MRLCMTNDRTLLYLLESCGGCQTLCIHYSTMEGPFLLENSVTRFRSLRELHVKTLDEGIPGNDIGAFLASLPPSLTKLVIGPTILTQNGTHSSVDLSTCLPALQTLHISAYTLEKLGTMRTLPNTLTNLVLEGRANPEDLAFLPRSLQALSLVVSGYDNDRFVRACCEHALPPALQTLKLFAVISATEEMIEALPRTIESLCMDGESTLPPSHVNHLPPTLTHYSLFSNSRLTDESLAKFPRTLTSLNLQFSSNVTSQGLRNLPIGLKSLTIRKCQNQPSLTSSASLANPSSSSSSSSISTITADTCISTLPRTLTAFEMLNGVSLNDETLTKQLLPSHLVHLRLSQDIPDSIESTSIAYLPRRMLTLVMGGSLLNDSASLLLPPRLTTLNLSLTSNITDTFFNSLPCTLLRLCLPSARNITDAAIAKLPRGLSFLQLLAAVQLTSNSIPHLPQSLQVLDLSENTNFDDNCIQHLPRTLTFLSLRQAKALTEACLPFLPKGLRLYVLPNHLSAKYREPLEELALLRKEKAKAYLHRREQQRPRSGSL